MLIAFHFMLMTFTKALIHLFTPTPASRIDRVNMPTILEENLWIQNGFTFEIMIKVCRDTWRSYSIEFSIGQSTSFME